MDFGDERLIVIGQDQSLDLDNNDEGKFNYLFYMLIAFVYAGLLITVVDKLLGSDKIEKHCSTDLYNFTTQKTDDYTTKLNKCKKLKKEFENKKFIYLIVLGLISVMGGVYAAHNNSSFCTGGSGVAAGGLLVIIYETLANWSELRTDVKIFMLGIALIALLYGSTRYYGSL